MTDYQPEEQREKRLKKKNNEESFRVLWSSRWEREWDIKKYVQRTSLAVQRLRLPAPNAGGMGSIPGQGTKIPHAARCSQKKLKMCRNSGKAPQIWKDIYLQTEETPGTPSGI